MGVRDVEEDEPPNPSTVNAAVVKARNRVVGYGHDQAERVFEIERKLLAPVGDQLMASSLGQLTENLQGVRRSDLGQSRLDLVSTPGTVLPSKPDWIVEEGRIALPSEAELHLAASSRKEYTNMV